MKPFFKKFQLSLLDSVLLFFIQCGKTNKNRRSLMKFYGALKSNNVPINSPFIDMLYMFHLPFISPTVFLCVIVFSIFLFPIDFSFFGILNFGKLI